MVSCGKRSPKADVRREQAPLTSSVLQAVISAFSEGFLGRTAAASNIWLLVAACKALAALQWQKEGAAAVLLGQVPPAGQGKVNSDFVCYWCSTGDESQDKVWSQLPKDACT